MMEIKAVRFCVRCGNRAVQKVIFKKQSVVDYIEDDQGSHPILWREYFLAECTTCDGLSMYEGEMWDIPCDASSFYDAKLVWPSKTKLDSDAIPKPILSIYEEASRIKLIAPGAFSVQIRRALEAICIDHGLKEKTLHINLKKLAEEGRLPPLLSEVTGIIKMIGNAGAHAVGPVIDISDALAIDDFFRVVLEYLYVAPSKLERFKNKVSKFSS